MASTTTSSDLKLEAANVSWGREECRSVLFVDDVAGSLTDEYFDLNVIGGDAVEVQYYVLLSGTTPATDPAPAGKTKIDVTYVDGDAAAAIGALYIAALAALDVVASISGDTVTVENVFVGPVTVEVYANAASLTGAQLRAGFGGSLGRTLDGIDFSVETQASELKTNQSGELVLGEIYQGSTASMSMSLTEMTTERWETIVGGVTGDIFTPNSGTRLVGGGVSRLFANLFDLGGKLTLHPVSRVTADRSFDMVFWKSAPKPESINFSGTDQQGMAVTFTAYNDSSKPDAISLWAEGDWTQELV